ncbi:hypothetical protein ACIGG9_27540 [Pseudonocardia alni]
MEVGEASRRGLAPRGVYSGTAVTGCEPDAVGLDPVLAVPASSKQHGLTVDDIDPWELDEALASQAVCCRDALGIDPPRFNVSGGAIAIGHPYGTTGARLVGHALLGGRRRAAPPRRRHHVRRRWHGRRRPLPAPLTGCEVAHAAGSPRERIGRPCASRRNGPRHGRPRKSGLGDTDQRAHHCDRRPRCRVTSLSVDPAPDCVRAVRAWSGRRESNPRSQFGSGGHRDASRPAALTSSELHPTRQTVTVSPRDYPPVLARIWHAALSEPSGSPLGRSHRYPPGPRGWTCRPQPRQQCPAGATRSSRRLFPGAAVSLGHASAAQRRSVSEPSSRQAAPPVMVSLRNLPNTSCNTLSSMPDS